MPTCSSTQNRFRGHPQRSKNKHAPVGHLNTDEENSAKKAEFEAIWKRKVGTFLRTQKQPRKGTWLTKIEDQRMLVTWVKAKVTKDSALRSFRSGHIIFQEPEEDPIGHGNQTQGSSQTQDHGGTPMPNTQEGGGPYSASPPQPRERAPRRAPSARAKGNTSNNSKKKGPERQVKIGRVCLDLSPPAHSRLRQPPRLVRGSALGGAEVSGSQRWLRRKAG